MKIIVGLGNPEKKYFITRHNIGFLAIDALMLNLHAIPIKSNHNSLLVKTSYAGSNVVLSKPKTFMNLSGTAVGELKKFYKLDQKDFLIIMDDYYLKFGTVKLLPSGGDGGHNGLKSIIENSGRKIPRLRLGVGAREDQDSKKFRIPLEKYVLADFTKEEQGELDEYLKFITKICLNFLDFGINDTMNRFNNCSYKDY